MLPQTNEFTNKETFDIKFMKCVVLLNKELMLKAGISQTSIPVLCP